LRIRAGLLYRHDLLKRESIVDLRLVCLDLEGILTPEIWIGLAERTGIDGFRATTRDVPDYDELMRQRLALMDEHGFGLPEIHAVVNELAPLPGAAEFVSWIRARYPLVVLSDTYYEFVDPFMEALGRPTLFCHSLVIEESGRIADYVLRHPDHKRATTAAFRALNFEVAAVGDSYNDTRMLTEADFGILFRAPDNVLAEFPQFPAVREYADLEDLLGAPEWPPQVERRDTA
jgi:phosphoserine/homoserine phosphotransferase